MSDISDLLTERDQLKAQVAELNADIDKFENSICMECDKLTASLRQAVRALEKADGVYRDSIEYLDYEKTGPRKLLDIIYAAHPELHETEER